MVFKNLKQLKDKIFGASKEATENPGSEQNDELCCNGNVHIAYRGLADDRMYISYDRKWKEVKYFRQNSLKVFCADCRRHIY